MNVLQYLENAILRKLEPMRGSALGGFGLTSINTHPFRAMEEVPDVAMKNAQSSVAPFGVLSFPMIEYVDSGVAGNVSRTKATAQYVAAFATASKTTQENKAFYFRVVDFFNSLMTEQIFESDEKPTGWEFVRIQPNLADYFEDEDEDGSGLFVVGIAFGVVIQSRASCSAGA